jgi:hypothetical protein
MLSSIAKTTVLTVAAGGGDEGNDDPDDRKPAFVLPPSTAKRPKLGGSRDATMRVTKGPEQSKDWSPIYYIAYWIDCAKTACATLVILLPSGICNEFDEDIVATVSEDRKNLLLEATWPDRFSNVQGMHEFWDITSFGPDEARDFQRRQISLEIVVDGMKESRRDHLKSTSSIELPFVSQKNVAGVFVLTEEDNINVLYVTVKEDKNSGFESAAAITLKRKTRTVSVSSRKNPPSKC